MQPRADGGESVHLTPNLDLSGTYGADVPFDEAELAAVADT